MFSLYLHESIVIETVTWKSGYFLFPVTWLGLRHVAGLRLEQPTLWEIEQTTQEHDFQEQNK